MNGAVAVLQYNLSKALKTLSGAISTSSNPQILRNALLRSKNGLCEIIGTDLETTQIIEVPCRVDRDFACLVDYATITEVVGQMNYRERIDITYDERESRLSVVQGWNKNRLVIASNIADFPATPSAELINDAEIIATVGDVRTFKDQLAHVARFTTTPRKNYSTRATEFLRLDVTLGEPLTICATNGFAASICAVEAYLQADADLTVFVPSKAFLKAVGAMASDDTEASRTLRGKRFGGVPFDLIWIDSENTLALRNPTRTILIRTEEKLTFSPAEYTVIACVPLMEQGKLAPVFKVVRRTKSSSLTIRVPDYRSVESTLLTDAKSIQFEGAGTTVQLESGDWESPYGAYLDVSATLELKGKEAIEALEDAISYRRNPKGADFDMMLFLAERRNGDWLLGLRGNGCEDIIVTENATIEWEYEEEVTGERT